MYMGTKMFYTLLIMTLVLALKRSLLSANKNRLCQQ